jgi:serine/threonine protein kinase
LSNRLASGPLPVAEALDLSIALADALVCLHAAAILHCDIKPSNIAFSNLGTPKLLDFGVARLRDAAETTETWGGIPKPVAAGQPSSGLQAFGTPAYMSPEALRHEPPSPLFDLWSLSVVLYESIAGVRPEPAAGPTDLSQHCAGSPEAVSAYLSEALHTNFARRPRSATVMAQGLRQLRSELQLG